VYQNAFIQFTGLTQNMDKMRKAIVTVTIVVLFVVSISGTVLYYQGLLNDKESMISVLEEQVANQSAEISDYQSQVSGLENQLASLTSINIVTALGVKEIGNLSGSHAAPNSYYRLFVSGLVTNDGNGTAFNAGLHVVAYDKDAILQINMTVPLIAGSTLANFTTVVKIDGSYGNPPLHFTNLAGGETTRVEFNIYHQGQLANWTVTPIYSRYPS
jgi:hypothetical protein